MSKIIEEDPEKCGLPQIKRHLQDSGLELIFDDQELSELERVAVSKVAQKVRQGGNQNEWMKLIRTAGVSHAKTGLVTLSKVLDLCDGKDELMAAARFFISEDVCAR